MGTAYEHISRQGNEEKTFCSASQSTNRQRMLIDHPNEAEIEVSFQS